MTVRMAACDQLFGILVYALKIVTSVLVETV